MKKPISENQDDTVQVTEISHEKIPPTPEKSAFIFHHTFYDKPKIDLEDAEVTNEIQQKLQILK